MEVVAGGSQVVLGGVHVEVVWSPPLSLYHHVPYSTPALRGEKYSNRPSEKSRPPQGHPIHWSHGRQDEHFEWDHLNDGYDRTSSMMVATAVCPPYWMVMDLKH